MDRLVATFVTCVVLGAVPWWSEWISLVTRLPSDAGVASKVIAAIVVLPSALQYGTIIAGFSWLLWAPSAPSSDTDAFSRQRSLTKWWFLAAVPTLVLSFVTPSANQRYLEISEAAHADDLPEIRRWDFFSEAPRSDRSLRQQSWANLLRLLFENGFSTSAAAEVSVRLGLGAQAVSFLGFVAALRPARGFTSRRQRVVITVLTIVVYEAAWRGLADLLPLPLTIWIVAALTILPVAALHLWRRKDRAVGEPVVTEEDDFTDRLNSPDDQEPGAVDQTIRDIGTANQARTASAARNIKSGKTADRPHYWTLALSICALLISVGGTLFSWRNSRVAEEAFTLNTNVSRSMVDVTAAELLKPAAIGEGPEVRITLQNSGKVPALIGRVTPWVQYQWSDGWGGALNGYQFEPRIEISPGFSRSIDVRASPLHAWVAGKQISDIRDYPGTIDLAVAGLIEYFDELTPKKRVITFCIGADLTIPNYQRISRECPAPPVVDDPAKLRDPNALAEAEKSKKWLGRFEYTVTAEIVAFPKTIRKGESSQLDWMTGNATTVAITPDVGQVGGNGSIKVTPTQTTTYRIEGSNSAGGFAKSVVTVRVIDQE